MRVNIEDENEKVHNRKKKTGKIKVYGQSDQSLAWEMFHMIYHMFSDIKNKEETNAALMITRMSYHKDMNKVIETTVDEFQPKMSPPISFSGT